MKPESVIFTALKGFVENRCYPTVFPQPPASPKWPAIRYTRVSVAPVLDLCGDGGDESADVRMQLDLVAQSSGAVETLRAQVMEAMAALVDPKPEWDSEFSTYDPETKTYRCVLDYLFHPSSGDGVESPPD